MECLCHIYIQVFCSREYEKCPQTQLSFNTFVTTSLLSRSVKNLGKGRQNPCKEGSLRFVDKTPYKKFCHSGSFQQGVRGGLRPSISIHVSGQRKAFLSATTTCRLDIGYLPSGPSHQGPPAAPGVPPFTLQKGSEGSWPHLMAVLWDGVLILIWFLLISDKFYLEKSSLYNTLPIDCRLPYAIGTNQSQRLSGWHILVSHHASPC